MSSCTMFLPYVSKRMISSYAPCDLTELQAENARDVPAGGKDMGVLFVMNLQETFQPGVASGCVVQR